MSAGALDDANDLSVAYLLNTYPVPSSTFIRREIRALEGLGVRVRRFAVRRFEHPLVDPADQAEQGHTTYLLDAGAVTLLFGGLIQAITNPRGMWRAKKAAFTLWRNAGYRGALRHVAYLLEAAALRQRLGDCTHVHAHFSTNTAAVALLCARMGGPGYSFTVHGPDELLDPQANSLAMKLHEARFAVPITDFARVQLVLAGGMDIWPKLHVVRCGVALDDLPAASAPAFDAPFVCVGRLCDQKAQTLIIEALAELRRTHPAAKVILIGDGDTRDRIETAIQEHQLQDAVELRGWADNADVRDALIDARALLLPSFAEGLPVVIMEAHALARPVISSYIAGIPELVDRESGWLVPAGNLPLLVSAMQDCLNTPPETLSRMGQVGRKRVEAAHDVTINAKRLRQLFAGPH